MHSDRADLLGRRLADFGRLMSLPRAEIALDEAALGIAAVLRPDLDVIGALSVLDEYAAQCATPTRDGVVAHLIGRLGFVGDRRTYGDWRNSCLDQVMAQRRGIPISLSVIMVEVARRVGVELHGVGMPAHFLVGDPADPEWFCDPFHGGQIRDRAQCRQLLDELTHGQIAWQESHLTPVDTRQIVARMLNNLKAGFAQRRDLVRLDLVMRLRSMLHEFADGPVAAAEREQARSIASVLN